MVRPMVRPVLRPKLELNGNSMRAEGGRERPSTVPIAALLGLAASVMLAACSGGDTTAKAATQVAARVNKTEISVHQINYLLQRQSGMSSDQLDAASKGALERLIEQELAVQRAKELELDRDPRIVQALEAARREVLARAYTDSVSDAALKPAPEDIRKYYDANPALFKQRRVYVVQEMAVDFEPRKLEDLRARVKAARSTEELAQSLEQGGYKFAGGRSTKSAEQIPIGLLPQFAALRDGEALVMPTSNGAHVVFLVSSQSAPVDESTARPAIERYLAIDNRRQAVSQQMKALREAARIEYVGNFAEAAPPPAAMASGVKGVQ
jgi:EpsD family peptidyl-prolyl cis-trans isomerase